MIVSFKWQRFSVEKQRRGNATILFPVMLHENEASSADTPTVWLGTEVFTFRPGLPIKLPSFSLNILVIQSAGLWSTDQGSDNTTHLSLTSWFHPITMWCKWKWKHPLCSYCHDNRMTSVLQWHSVFITWTALCGVSDSSAKEVLNSLFSGSETLCMSVKLLYFLAISIVWPVVFCFFNTCFLHLSAFIVLPHEWKWVDVCWLQV